MGHHAEHMGPWNVFTQHTVQIRLDVCFFMAKPAKFPLPGLKSILLSVVPHHELAHESFLHQSDCSWVPARYSISLQGSIFLEYSAPSKIQMGYSQVLLVGGGTPASHSFPCVST